MKTRASICVALVGVTSCSLLTRLDGLSNGDPAVEADGATSPEGGSNDASPDGTVPPTPDGGFSCAPLSPAPRLCVDFSNDIVATTGTPAATSHLTDGGEEHVHQDVSRATPRLRRARAFWGRTHRAFFNVEDCVLQR
jgi:hypothetical protein